MQFEMNVTVLGVTRVTVDGRTFSSVFTGQDPVGDNAANTRGYEVTKIGCDPQVFDQLPNLKPGDNVSFVAMLRKAAGGKSQPFFVGVVPEKAAGSTANKQPADK